MLDFNYIFHFLNNHAIKMLLVPKGTTEWIYATEDSAVELYNALWEEEQRILNSIGIQASSTYTIGE